MYPSDYIYCPDGSYTLKLKSHRESYHSKEGALSESKYIYIQNGLKKFPKNSKVSILEVGLGTGLNTLLTWNQKTYKTDYTALEPYPISKEHIQFLTTKCPIPYQKNFNLIHQLNWDQKHSINSNISFTKYKQDILSFSPPKKYNLIYYDTFASHVQPELWSPTAAKKIASLLSPNGIMVTYSTQPDFLIYLKNENLTIEKLPGPLKKRYITRASLIR